MANWLDLDGKVVIVTGGASGIGNHVVTTLKDAGATPVIPSSFQQFIVGFLPFLGRL